MIEIRQVLCPIDFSDASRHALEHAVAIATWYKSQLTALHVIHVPVMYPHPLMMPVEAGPTLPTAADRQAHEEQLRSWLEPARRGGISTQVVVDEGIAALQILEQARARKTDLIVMGTHGLSGFERFMLGSVTEKILRKASCPVLTVPPASGTTAKVPYKRLLCPIDFSGSSQSALRFASSLAKEADANLCVLHVIDWPTDHDFMVKRFEEEAFRRAVEDDARRRLEGLLIEDIRVACKPVTAIEYGKPYQRILAVAERDAADLIVIGVRGRNPLGLAVFGSTTNQVVRSASCPVLTLKQ